MLVGQVGLMEAKNGNWELVFCQYAHSLARVSDEERSKIQAKFRETRQRKRGTTYWDNKMVVPRVCAEEFSEFKVLQLMDKLARNDLSRFKAIHWLTAAAHLPISRRFQRDSKVPVNKQLGPPAILAELE
jgi:hypothetical protein